MTATTVVAETGRKLRESARFDENVAESAASASRHDGFLRMKLDRFDKAILQALQLDGRVSNAALAERLSLSESACLRRVRALEESGLIEGYTALLNQQKAGCPVNVFVNITLDRQDETDLRKFEEAVRKIPEVMECYLMTGASDYLLRVVVPDLDAFQVFVTEFLSRAPGVGSIQSSVALKQVKYQTALPLRAAT